MFIHMYPYEVEPDFGLRLILLLTVFGLLVFTFNFVMRKWLKVDKKPSFFITYVNDKHKKIHNFILFVFLVAMLIGFMINVSKPPMEYVWFLQPHIFLFLFFVTTDIARAIMERKYAPNKNDYILTVSEIVFMCIIFIIMILTNFFGLAN